MKMIILNNHWNDFSDIPINNDGFILKDFLHFPKLVTHREDVWEWFESQNPKFSIAEKLYR